MWDVSLYDLSLEWLKLLIATPSFSREETGTASLIEGFLLSKGVSPRRKGNNIWALNRYFRSDRPTILLNSHHDTVKPNAAYTRDPFRPEIVEGKLYGLGSNDAGGCMVGLIAAFLHFHERRDLAFNLILTATAEEEISGFNGVEGILPEMPGFEFAIVGEPTLTQMAIAEKGLLVLDCVVRGISGHAAREEGDNAIYKAIPDIEWFRNFRFPRISDTLGPIKMSVTMIQAGSQHNVVPALCSFSVDIRVTECYTHEELVAFIRGQVSCEVNPRSLRMRSSGISADHPLVGAALRIGKTLYGSPTTSDQALIPTPSVKIGPGDSARSHSADEFIYLDEIREGIDTYIRLLEELMKPLP